MLQFYYDFLCKFLDPMVFQLLEMDTDSMDMALTGKSVESMIKPELRAEFELEKNQKIMVCGHSSEREAYSKARRTNMLRRGSKKQHPTTVPRKLQASAAGRCAASGQQGFSQQRQCSQRWAYPYDKRLVLCDGVTTQPRVD